MQYLSTAAGLAPLPLSGVRSFNLSYNTKQNLVVLGRIKLPLSGNRPPALSLYYRTLNLVVPVRIELTRPRRRLSAWCFPIKHRYYCAGLAGLRAEACHMLYCRHIPLLLDFYIIRCFTIFVKLLFFIKKARLLNASGL